MLFLEIIKKTSTAHKDYQQFLEVQATFKRILTQVNNEVDHIIRRMRLNELDCEFGTPDCPIYIDSREYLDEFSLSLIKEPYPQQVILVINNDLLLIIDEASRKLIKSIPVNE
jgi:hypothetical protein